MAGCICYVTGMESCMLLFVSCQKVKNTVVNPKKLGSSALNDCFFCIFGENIRNMKKILLSLYALLVAFNLQAQIGATAPDFTLVDINGDTVNLYEILDAGLIAVVDVSATWCAPCWTLHQSHALKELHEKHGPDGSNQLRVMFYEGDAATTLADLKGTGTNTKGDWVTGVPYPIFNESPLTLDLGIWAPQGFPTVNIINPSDKKIVGDSWDLTSYDGQVTKIESTTGIDLVDAVTGLETLEQTAFSVYPNPTSERFYIQSDDFTGVVSVTIFNLLGQAVLQDQVADSSHGIDVSSLKKGSYLLRISNNGKETTRRLVIARP